MSDGYIAKDAMERSMAILKEDPTSRTTTHCKRSLCTSVVLQGSIRKGSVPAAFEGFLKEPKPPEGVNEPVAEESSRRRTTAPAVRMPKEEAPEEGGGGKRA